MTFQQLLNRADSDENCILCFGNNETARSFVDFVKTKRMVAGYEDEVYRCGSHQLRYNHGMCVGTSTIGFDTDFYMHKYNNAYKFYHYSKTAKVV